jgi:hypothetical protein
MAIEWQPIETAPKNEAGEFLGPTILIYYAADGLTWPAYWGPEKGSLVDGAWHVADDYGDDRPFNTPDVTHWAPMPNPPELPES